jgi:hypothetical protein
MEGLSYVSTGGPSLLLPNTPNRADEDVRPNRRAWLRTGCSVSGAVPCPQRPLAIVEVCEPPGVVTG